MPQKKSHPETVVLHAGYRHDPETGAVAVPIYQTTSYQFQHTQHAENLFALKELGNIYTRIMNPTCDVLEQRITALEGGAASLALGSGQAASTFAVLNLCQAGDNFVSSTDLYGGTWNLFANTLSGLGVEVRFVDPADPAAFRKATDSKTRCYYAETLPNPKLNVFPIREVADIGRELGVPLIVDNTAAPILCRPLDHGAAVIVYSTTKYIGGHGTSIGGLIVDGGNFDWEAHADRFPSLTQPDPSYHGAVWTEAVKPLGPIAYIIRARVVLLRDVGAAMSPFNAFMFIQGMETLPLRIRAHCDNAAKVAQFLKGHPKVATVIWPGFQDGEVRRRADAYLDGGLIVDGGNFDWEAHADRFPSLTQPDPSYHGAVWTEAVKPLGPIAYIIRARVVLLRDIGAPMSPFNAFMFIQGMETLPLRSRAHCDNANKVAQFLKGHPKVATVIWPGFQDGEVRRRADTYLEGGYGALVGFELKEGREAGRRFIDALKMVYHVANIGDARTLAIHPASTTHSQLSPEDRLATGVSEGYIRLSIGIEHIDDILEDLGQALEEA